MNDSLRVFLLSALVAISLVYLQQWRTTPSTAASPDFRLVAKSTVTKLHIPPDATLQIEVPATIYMGDGSCWRYDGRWQRMPFAAASPEWGRL